MPFLCFELGAFFFLFKFFRSNRLQDLIWSAVFLAFSLLVRTNLLAFLPVIALTIWWAKKNWSRVAIYVAVTVVVISPYYIRNGINNRAFFPFDGKAALNLWQFNSDVHQGSFSGEDFLQAPPMPPLDGLTEKQRADLLMGIGQQWIKDHPLGFARLSLMRGLRFLSPFPHMSDHGKLALLLTPYSLPLLVGFFIGLRSLSWRDPEHWLIVLLFLYTLAIDMVFMSATRHRILYDPFFLLVGFKWLSDQRWLASFTRAN
jgi:hypothetical protein